MIGKHKIDTTRASRAGHEFHEAWTARKALQLFWPDNDLVGIAVEGLSPYDQARAPKAAVEIADLALYFGREPSFQHGARTTIAQFKYSIADKDKDFRASDARKTIGKFATTFNDYKKRYGAQNVAERLDFLLTTNQPVFSPLLEAIQAIANGSPRIGDVKRQADQFIAAAGLRSNQLAEFAGKVSIIGRAGSLRATKDALENLLVDWSATNDPLARERLGRLRDLVREKAGYAGTNQNLITRPDVLAALKVADADDLLPCKTRLVDVGPVVEREQLPDALERIESATRPVLIHADGGVGKTVFLESIGRRLAEANEVVFFDCFGGGAYRSLEDARHRLNQGLIHIANTLSFRGLCDPMLPESQDQQALMRTFRRRLEQCVATMSRVVPGRKLVLLIDAIDNAEIAARQRSEDAFPIRLLESIDAEPIAGVKIVASCRSHRKPITHAGYDAFELRPFSNAETRTFVRARVSGATDAEINVAQARSGGNPRILDYLLLSGRGLLDASETEKPIELPDLIQKRITDALATAVERGYQQQDIDVFLAGLAVLPPPVPLDEYAGAQGIELSAVNSFASDLAPLLERTNQGLIFKDEPTETLVRERYASSRDALKRVGANLLARQDESIYAARALPGLLHELDDGERLFSLAFDDRIPASVKSTVGKRNIRYARLQAATLHAALKNDHDRLVSLLVELSTIASVDQRGARYILEHPDLVVAASDDDARRRLFETHSGWPGTRHARLAIANTLAGDIEEASRHVFAAHEWIEHARRAKAAVLREEGPERLDIAAIPFFMITSGKVQNAAPYLRRWYDWYAFEVCEQIFAYSYFAQAVGLQTKERFRTFLGSLTEIGHLAAALSFVRLSKPMARELVGRLARRCRAKSELRFSSSYSRDREYDLEDGLQKASALAVALGLGTEALAISLRVPHDRPRVWSFRDVSDSGPVSRFIFGVALSAAAKKADIHEKDLLPKELVPVCSQIPRSVTGSDFHDKASKKLSKTPLKPQDGDKALAHPHAMSYEDKQSAERFLGIRLAPLLALTNALSLALAASPRQIDARFVQLVEAWEAARKTKESYRTGDVDFFFQSLGLSAALLVLWTRHDLKQASIQRLLTAVHAQDAGAKNLIRIVAILAQRDELRPLAGTQAVEASGLVRSENDVTYRAALYADLAQAMIPASRDEAVHYFREGLEQMDAIGSGDYEFTNELLLFASTMKGDELEAHDFHTLSNIAELNMGEEPEKFYWGAYGRGLAKAAGLRGLAKLSRWDDRGQIALSNTLLPYLIGLLEHGKIEPRDALALNRLADPVEYFYCSTAEFADEIRKRAGRDPEVVTALIEQYRDNNPGTWMEGTAAKLATLAAEALGPSSDLARHLSDATSLHARVRDARNEQQNYRGRPDAHLHARSEDDKRARRESLARIAKNTDPALESSLVQAITEFNLVQSTYDVKDEFFASLRAKLDYAMRADYLRHVAALGHLFYYWKFAELKQAKLAWAESSASLAPVLKSLAMPLIKRHADDLLSNGRVSTSNIHEISELTGVPMVELVLELIKEYARPGRTIPGAAWLAFASLICPHVSDGKGQAALVRLVRSDAADLANNVTDGTYKTDLYPRSDLTEIAAGLIWRVLGSPEAESRWRAAHTMRDFAALGNWHVIDSLVERWGSTTAGPFQASELNFYYLHARLWLLVALARIALDHPDRIAAYKDALLGVVTDTKTAHVLMRHFAARALSACIDAGKLTLEAKTLALVLNADGSPHPRLKAKIRVGGDFYAARPQGTPKPPFEFHLDYDFHKSDVDGLGRTFGKPCWLVADMISAIVHGIDPQVTSMYESQRRKRQYGRSHYGITSRFHDYGHQLGWHALFLAAGQLLASFPVTDDSGYDEPWVEWLGRSLLTRDDGLWLSDGTDRTPLDARPILLEQKTKGLAVTGDQARILNLAVLSGTLVDKEVVVEGSWYSADQVQIEVSSALVAPTKAAQLARKLLREEPMIAWLPVLHHAEDDEYPLSDKTGYAPWVVCPSGESRLDEHDPYGVSVANLRPRLARDYASLLKLISDDPFHRAWRDERGAVALRAQAWGRDATDRNEDPHSGLRLLCHPSVLEKVLAAHDADLLILIRLQRYEKGYQSSSTYAHSIAVVRVKQSLDVEYFKGCINRVHKPRY